MSEKRVVRTVRRGGVVDDTPVAGNLVKPKAAKYISLVAVPANQTPIKITRSAQEPEKTAPRRLRRSDTSKQPVLRLTFPEGTDAEGVTAVLKLYGMEDYTVAESEGVFTATRSDLKSIAKDGTTQIKLTEDGLTATVIRSAAIDGGETGSKLAVTSITFDAEKFTSDEAAAWLADNGVDGDLNSADDAHTVKRSDVADGQEVRQMQIDDGVTVSVVRADVNGVPDGLIAVVCEAAYGGWGWGQLDFSAMMADVVFSEKSREAVSRLESVLRNIMFYSDLPLDVRKTLMNNALGQFGAYMGTLMDALPKQLMLSVVRSDNFQQEKAMTKQATTATPEVTTNNPAATQQVATPSNEVEALRNDVATLTKTVGDLAAIVKRSVPMTDEEKAAQAAAEAAKPVTRSDLTAIVADALKPVQDELATLKGTTVVRSADSTQDTAPAAKSEPTTTEAKRGEVFRGAFGNMAGLRK